MFIVLTPTNIFLLFLGDWLFITCWAIPPGALPVPAFMEFYISFLVFFLFTANVLTFIYKRYKRLKNNAYIVLLTFEILNTKSFLQLADVIFIHSMYYQNDKIYLKLSKLWFLFVPNIDDIVSMVFPISFFGKLLYSRLAKKMAPF